MQGTVCIGGFYALTESRVFNRKIKRSQPAAAPTFRTRFNVGAAAGSGRVRTIFSFLMKFYLESLPSFLGKMPLNVEYS